MRHLLIIIIGLLMAVSCEKPEMCDVVVTSITGSHPLYSVSYSDGTSEFKGSADVDGFIQIGDCKL